MSLRERVRGWFPPNGLCYELFDGSVCLALVGLFGYILGNVPGVVEQAIFWLRVLPDTAIGWMLVGAGCIGVACSYSTRERIIYAGYTVATTAAGVMFVNFIWGALFSDYGWRAVSSAVVYGYIGRRLMRDNREAGETDL